MQFAGYFTRTQDPISDLCCLSLNLDIDIGGTGSKVSSGVRIEDLPSMSTIWWQTSAHSSVWGQSIHTSEGDLPGTLRVKTPFAIHGQSSRFHCISRTTRWRFQIEQGLARSRASNASLRISPQTAFHAAEAIYISVSEYTSPIFVCSRKVSKMKSLPRLRHVRKLATAAWP